MKKIDFYTLVWTFEKGVSSAGEPGKLKVSGYQIDENTAMYKNGNVWSVIDLKTGRDLVTKSCFSRKEALENCEGRDPLAVVGEKVYKEYVEIFNNAPDVEESGREYLH